MFDSIRRGRRTRRSRARDVLAERVERMEPRMMLSSAPHEGSYFWANGERIALHPAADDLADVGSHASVAAISDSSSDRPVEFVVEGTGTRVRLTDEIYVRLDGKEPQAVFTAENGFRSFALVPGTSDQYVATVAAGTNASLDLANELHGSPGVAFAHPNFVVNGWTASNDPVYGSQWNLHNTGQGGGTFDADVDAPEAWAVTSGSPDVVVAVLDTGIQLDHPDLADSIFVNAGEIPGNGIDDDGNGWIDDVNGLDLGGDLGSTSQIEYDGDPNPATEFDNHGTAVAGVIAAQANNGVGITGVAPGVKILPIKIGTTTSSTGGFSVTVSALVAAVYYAAGRTADGSGTWRGADVANHSWGIGFPLTALTRAFDWAASEGRGGLGMANFVSAGNSGEATVSYPASLASTIAVGATDHHGAKSDFSQFGAGLDFVAPGGGGASSGWIWTTDRSGGDGYVSSDYVGITGTSFSSPTAAGIAALMLSVDPELRAEEIREVMRETADRDKVSGVAFNAAGWNSQYGHGWLNAGAAVAAAADLGGTDPGGGQSGGSGGGTDPGSGGGVSLGGDVVGREDRSGFWWVSVSDGSQFQTYRWGAWATGIEWVDFLTGDFNGDGRQDVTARDASSGNIWVGLSTGHGLITQIWDQWSTIVDLSEAHVGDFDGDGKDDLAVRVENDGDGRWYVAESSGGSFVTNVWGGWTTIKDWGQVQTGDFDGDGRTDLAGRIQNAGDGRWSVLLSSGSRFVGSTWGAWSTAVAWDVHTGDVDGDGRTDLIARTGNDGDGRWFYSISTGTSLKNGLWGRVAPHLARGDALVADFTGDGKADVAVREADDGRWYVVRSTGTASVTELWGAWLTKSWTNLVVGDFNQDGVADVAGRDRATGDWQVARSTTASFVSSIWGRWGAGDWSFAAVADVS